MSVGVVLMAYGTPASADDVEDYYTHIRRGRPPTVEQLDELRARYAAIGGVSPMARHTAAQVAAIDAALQASEPGRFEVSLGQKHAAPFVEDAVEELSALGADRVVGLVLAPHWSSSSIGEYHDRARRVTEEHRIRYDGIDSWSDEPAFIDHQARAVLRRLAELPERTKVLFTAHSLPLRVLDGDPYPGQRRASATAIAEQAGHDQHDRRGRACDKARVEHRQARVGLCERVPLALPRAAVRRSSLFFLSPPMPISQGASSFSIMREADATMSVLSLWP